MLNWSPSKYIFLYELTVISLVKDWIESLVKDWIHFPKNFLYVITDELRVPFNMSSKWSMSRQIVQIKCSDELNIRAKIFNLIFEGYYTSLQREGGASGASGTVDSTGLSDFSAERMVTGFGTPSREVSQLMAAGPFDTSSFCDLIKEILN